MSGASAAGPVSAPLVRRTAIRLISLVLLDVGGLIYDDASYMDGRDDDR